MRSSTLHSKVPWTALGLLAAALAAWGSSDLYTLYLNPEIAFFKHAFTVKHQWAQKLDREYPHKVVVFGGSGCGVSVDGEWMLEKHRMPTVNMGLGAGMGAAVLTRVALKEVRDGDTLIASLENPTQSPCTPRTPPGPTPALSP